MNISSYIKAALSKNVSKEEIYLELLKKGEKVDHITEEFKKSSRESKDVQKQTTHTILIIGAILIAAGIFSFIASNWQELGKTAKIAIIIISMLTSHIAGFQLKERAGYEKIGKALIFLGTLIYGAGIFLIGQMFNIRADWPDGLILWLLGTLAIAFAVGDSLVLFYLALVLGVISNGGEIFEIFNRFQSTHYLITSLPLIIISAISCYLASNHLKKTPEISKDLQDSFILLALMFLGTILTLLNQQLLNAFSGLTILSITSSISLFAAYYYKSPLILIFGLLGILTWWETKSLEWIGAKEIKSLAFVTSNILIGIFFFLLTPLHKNKLPGFSRIFGFLGTAFITAILLILSTKDGIRELILDTAINPIFNSWQVTTGLLSLAAGIIISSIFNIKNQLLLKREVLTVNILSIFFIIMTLLTSDLINFKGAEMFWAAIFNLLFFAEIIAIIFMGYWRKSNIHINLGVVLMAIFILMKYFDWFFTFLSKSLFFILAGILLFIIGFFMEKTRKYLISQIEHEQKL